MAEATSIISGGMNAILGHLGRSVGCPLQDGVAHGPYSSRSKVSGCIRAFCFGEHGRVRGLPTADDVALAPDCQAWHGKGNAHHQDTTIASGCLTSRTTPTEATAPAGC